MVRIVLVILAEIIISPTSGKKVVGLFYVRNESRNLTGMK